MNETTEIGDEQCTDEWLRKRLKLSAFIRNENITPDIVVWVLEQIFPASEEMTMCCGKKGGVLLVKHIPACDDPIHS
jgi:hypothetical protein